MASIYDGIQTKQVCRRCMGSGAWYGAYGTRTCFGCNGTGAATGIRSIRVGVTAEDRMELQRRKDAAAQAKLASKVARNVAAYPVLAGLYDDQGNVAYDGRDRITRDILDKGRKYDLTEKQVAAVVRTITREAAWKQEAEDRKATATPLLAGRQTITGKVTSCKWKDGAYGSGFKWIVQTEDGARVYGSVPAAWQDAAEMDQLVGQEVTFKATVTVSDDDQTFGFAKRPAIAAA